MLIWVVCEVVFLLHFIPPADSPPEYYNPSILGTLQRGPDVWKPPHMHVYIYTYIYISLSLSLSLSLSTYLHTYIHKILSPWFGDSWGFGMRGLGVGAGLRFWGVRC